MGLLSKTLSPELLIPDGIRRGAQRRGWELAGAALMALAILLGASLATWSIQDPSINHAASRTPQNLLGYPGAVVADLAMQIFGLAGALLAPTLLRWGWLYLRHRPLPRLGPRAAAAVAALIFAAAALAALPAPGRWPLPAGLGGFLGDWLLDLSLLLGGARPGFWVLAAAATAFAALALSLLAYATAIRLSDIFSREDALLALEREPPAEKDDGGHWLGALSHSVLSAKARLSRLWRGRAGTTRPGLPAQWRDLFFVGAAADPIAPGERREPVFVAPGALAHLDDDLGLAGEAGASDPSGARRAYDIAPVAGELRKGRRLRQEAQPSLLPSDEFQLPALGLLDQVRTAKRPGSLSKEALEQNARMLESVLDDFGVRGEIINVRPGPVVTLYELEPAPGIKSSRVIGLSDDIARSMSAVSARVAVVPGRNAIGIELPNSEREMVYLREILQSEDFERSKARLPLALGKTIGGEPVIADLSRMPHLLIAGTTGSGKSVGINTMILSLLYRLPPDKCKLIMVDPKMLELSVYDGIPHLLAPVVTDPRKAVTALKWTVREMEDRYKLMSKLGVRNIDGYNQRVEEALANNEIITRTVQTGFDPETGQPVYESEEMDLQPLPYLVVIVDEMADLMMVAGKDIEGAVQRLAQMARAAGIHMITATQRPSVDVITGTIKANFPTRISFQVTSKIDSRTILGEQGAEQLLGQGDMLYMAGGGRISRVHGPFVSDDNVEKVVRHLKRQGAPDYLDDVTAETEDGDFDAAGLLGGGEADDLYQRAVQVVVRDKKASTSYIQRRLAIGYNRAASIMERMEQEGVVSQPNHAGKREILLGDGA